MPEPLSYYSRTPVLLCQNPCPIMPEPLSYYARTLVLLCQNPCPIMPEPLSYYARTPVLLWQNPCPIMPEPLSYYARTPVLLSQKPCPFIPKPQKFLKNTLYFFKKFCPILPKTVSDFRVSKSPIISPTKSKLSFVPEPFFITLLLGLVLPFRTLLVFFPSCCWVQTNPRSKEG